MQSFAAGAFEDRLQPFLLQPLPQVLRGQLERLERHIRRGVEVEYQPVGIIDRIDGRTPGMDLDRAHLDDFQQAFFVFDVEVFVTLALVPEFERMDVCPEPFAGVALIETLAVDAGGTAQQAERMAGNPGQHERRDGGMIFGELALGDMAGFGNDPVRVGDGDAGGHESARFFL